MNSSVDCPVAPHAATRSPRRCSDFEVADLLLVIDSLASIREIGPSVRSHLGRRRGELLGADFFQILHPDDLALVRSLLRGDQNPVRVDLRLRHQSGHWRSFCVEARCVPGPDRQTLLVLQGSDTSVCEPELVVANPAMQIGGAMVPVPDRGGEGEPRVLEDTVNPDLIERAHAQSEVVLVALDDVRVSAQASSIMRQLGYTVLESTGPADAEGYARVHQGTIHLLVTDLATPRVGGRAFVRAMQAIRPGLKSLFISRQGYGSLAERRVYESGARLLHQPFTSEELAHALRRALESAHD